MENSPTIATENYQPQLRDLLSHGVQRLVAAGIQSARLDAEVLLGHVLALTREQLIAGLALPLRTEQVRRYETLLTRRLQREPVAYITERQEFWSLNFLVTPAVLIPRPETERLIEVSLMLASDLCSDKPLSVIDIGTGSGAIAVSLAKELVAARIWATDISPAALAIAHNNASLNGVADRITFLCSDLLMSLPAGTGPMDLMVSNPPYIRRDQYPTLEPEVGQWEPRAALDGGADGLDFYRRIAAQAVPFLAPNGVVVLEIGAEMGREVAALFNDTSCYSDVAIFQDYAGRDRVVVAKTAAQRASSN